MLQKSEKFAAKVDILNFKKKKLIKVLNVEKQKKNRSKQLNLLSKKDNSPKLFSPSRIQAT